MEKIIVKRSLIRISKATFKEVLEAVASDGEVYFNFKDGAKKAKVKYGDNVFDVEVRRHPCSKDKIFVDGYHHSLDYKRADAQRRLQSKIDWRLKSKYKIVYEDIEI
jgi:hypothetical protein